MVWKVILIYEDNIIRIRMMASLRNQAFFIFMENNFFTSWQLQTHSSIIRVIKQRNKKTNINSQKGPLKS